MRRRDASACKYCAWILCLRHGVLKSQPHLCLFQSMELIVLEQAGTCMMLDINCCLIKEFKFCKPMLTVLVCPVVRQLLKYLPMGLVPCRCRCHWVAVAVAGPLPWSMTATLRYIEMEFAWLGIVRQSIPSVVAILWKRGTLLLSAPCSFNIVFFSTVLLEFWRKLARKRRQSFARNSSFHDSSSWQYEDYVSIKKLSIQGRAPFPRKRRSGKKRKEELATTKKKRRFEDEN